MLRTVLNARILRKMPAPRKRKDGPKQVKKPPPKPKPTMLQIREKYLEELPPLPYLAYPDERCFLEEYKRPVTHVTNEELERRVAVQKEYSRYCNRFWWQERQNFKEQVRLRAEALKHLKLASEDLYNHATNFSYDVFPSEQVEGGKESMPNPQHIPPLKKDVKLLYQEEAVASSRSVKVDDNYRKSGGERKAKPKQLKI